jgi:hypothetical protein
MNNNLPLILYGAGRYALENLDLDKFDSPPFVFAMPIRKSIARYLWGYPCCRLTKRG